MLVIQALLGLTERGFAWAERVRPWRLSVVVSSTLPPRSPWLSSLRLPSQPRPVTCDPVTYILAELDRNSAMC